MKTRWFIVASLAAAVLVLVSGRTDKTTLEQPAALTEAFQTRTEDAAAELMLHSRPAKARIVGADTVQRTEQLRTLVGDIEKAIASEDESERDRIFQGLLASLVDLHPAAAAALLAKIEPGAFRQDYLLRLAQLWTARDSNAALQWASGLAEPSEREDTLRSVYVEMAQTDPQTAISTMESMGVPDEKSTLDNMIQLWACKDISAATTWALTKPEGEPRDALVARVAYVMAQQNPLEAARLVVNSMAAGEVQTEAAISIVHRWALQDWNSAKGWVDIFPEGPLRERARNELAGIKAYVEAQRQARTAQ